MQFVDLANKVLVYIHLQAKRVSPRYEDFVEMVWYHGVRDACYPFVLAGLNDYLQVISLIEERNARLNWCLCAAVNDVRFVLFDYGGEFHINLDGKTTGAVLKVREAGQAIRVYLQILSRGRHVQKRRVVFAS